MSGHRKIRFRLEIPAHKFLRYYQGSIEWIQVKAFDGTRVRFPASALRRFVTRDGVVGTFEMIVTDENRLVRIRRLDMD